jgi:vacuolar-type H+-ATPase subunit H
VQRLKDARTEANKEIEEIKAQKNAEYQKFVSEVSTTEILAYPVNQIRCINASRIDY